MNTAHRIQRTAHWAFGVLCGLALAPATLMAQNGNIAVNTTGAAAAPTALLDVSSVTQGLFMPRLSSLPGASGLPQGLTVYRTTAPKGFYAVDYGQWMPLVPVDNGNGWDLYGNYLSTPTDPNKDFIGTTDNRPMYFRTNNQHRMRLDANTGYLGVGYAAGAPPALEQLDVNGTLRLFKAPPSPQYTSDTDAPGVVRYQPFGSVTGSPGQEHGTLEMMAVTGSVSPQPPYAVQFAGHWGNIDGTSVEKGQTSPTVIAPSSKGWRLFENPYSEARKKPWTHFKEAVCTPGTDAELPSGVTQVWSNGSAVPAAEQEFVTPFFAGALSSFAPAWRRQYLFHADELNMEIAQSKGIPAVAGLCPGEAVNAIAFRVDGINPRNLINADITVKHAPDGLNSLNGFDNSPYYGTLSCGTPSGPWPSTTGVHWESVSLSPPFVWDGHSNVIIEVAFKANGSQGNGTNSRVISTQTSFTATYGTTSMVPGAQYIPLVATTPPYSCNNTGNPATLLPSTGSNAAIYHQGSSTFRPVVRFSGTTAVPSTAATTGTGNYIYYQGGLVVEDTLGLAAGGRPWGLWRTGYPTGNPYWAFQGKGTISAQHGVYDNGVRLNDYILDRAFDGRVAPQDAAAHGDYLPLNISELSAYTREHRHLPTMKGRAAWNAQGGFSLGDLTNQLWATTEAQALHVADLHDKLNTIEILSTDRPLRPAEFRTAKKDLAEMAEFSDAEKARLIAALEKRVATSH